jgi:hypothetical protein
MLVGLVEASAAVFGSQIVSKVLRKKYTMTAFGIIAILTACMGI